MYTHVKFQISNQTMRSWPQATGSPGLSLHCAIMVQISFTSSKNGLREGGSWPSSASMALEPSSDGLCVPTSRVICSEKNWRSRGNIVKVQPTEAWPLQTHCSKCIHGRRVATHFPGWTEQHIMLLAAAIQNTENLQPRAARQRNIEQSDVQLTDMGKWKRKPLASILRPSLSSKLQTLNHQKWSHIYQSYPPYPTSSSHIVCKNDYCAL